MSKPIIGRPRLERPPGLPGELAARLERLREARGWTRDQLAERAGIGGGSVSRLERGDGSPTLQMVGKIAGALGVKPSELLMGLPGW